MQILYLDQYYIMNIYIRDASIALLRRLMVHSHHARHVASCFTLLTSFVHTLTLISDAEKQQDAWEIAGESFFSSLSRHAYTRYNNMYAMLREEKRSKTATTIIPLFLREKRPEQRRLTWERRDRAR